jgi:uncharacterized protein YfaQ (DUF2300 family)
MIGQLLLAAMMSATAASAAGPSPPAFPTRQLPQNGIEARALTRTSPNTYLASFVTVTIRLTKQQTHQPVHGDGDGDGDGDEAYCVSLPAMYSRSRSPRVATSIMNASASSMSNRPSAIPLM